MDEQFLLSVDDIVLYSLVHCGQSNYVLVEREHNCSANSIARRPITGQVH